MLKLFLWLRYLRKKKIVFLCIAAVALSVALLLVVDSFFNGLIDGLEKTVLLENGDIFLYTYRKSFPHYDSFVSMLETIDEVEAAAPTCNGSGLLWLETGDVREVYIKGIEPQKESEFVNWTNNLINQKAGDKPLNFDVPGKGDANGVWAGVNIVAEPNERTDTYDTEYLKKLIGKKVVLTTLGADEKRKVISLWIADIAQTDTFWGDQTIYMPYEQLYEILTGLEQDGYASSIKIKLTKNAKLDKAKESITSAWIKFASEQLHWESEDILRINLQAPQEQQYEYFDELYKQMAVLLLIFTVLCSVVILLVFCIFYMIVETRLKDIAIIKSCGASSTTAALIFAGFGGCIGLAGSGFGIIIGYIIIKNVNIIERGIHIITGIKLWRRSSYILNYIPDQVNWHDVLPIVLAAVAGCCLGALIPAIVAARTKPIDILRYE